jgi:hypothetical protein
LLSSADVCPLDDLIVVGSIERSAVKGARALHVESATNVAKGRKRHPSRILILTYTGKLEISSLLGEISGEVKSTSNNLQALESIDNLQIGVVGNLVTTVDLLEFGERDAGQAWVVIEDKRLSSPSQVGAGEALEVVGVETKGAVDRGERRQVDFATVAESHVEGKHEVGEAGRQSMAVGLDVQSLGDIGHLHVDVLQVRVVVHVESLHGLKVDAVKGVELGIANGDIASLSDTVGERELLQGRKSNPVDVIDLGEGRHVQRRENGKARKFKRLVDFSEVVGFEGGQVDSAITDEAASDTLNTIQGDCAGSLGSNDNVALVDGAAAKGGSIATILDGSSASASSLSCMEKR